MKVLLFEPRFWKPVVSGDKLHTIRPTRKRPICPGDSLSLRGWEGKPYRSRQRVLCEEVCLMVRECWIDMDGVVIDGHRFDDYELDAFAVSDGFEDWQQMREFRHFVSKLPFSGDLIQWGVHPLLANVVSA